MKVAEIRDELVQMGMSQKEANAIKGKALLLEQLNDMIEEEEVAKVIVDEEIENFLNTTQGPLQLILEQLTGIQASIGDLHTRVDAVESRTLAEVEHIVIAKADPAEINEGVTTINDGSYPTEKNLGRKEVWNKNKKKGKPWIDRMTDCTELTIDEINKRGYADDPNNPIKEQLSHKAARQESRPAIKKVRAVCVICQSVEFVVPALAPRNKQTYRCNSCCGGSN